MGGGMYERQAGAGHPDIREIIFYMVGPVTEKGMGPMLQDTRLQTCFHSDLTHIEEVFCHQSTFGDITPLMNNIHSFLRKE